VELSILSPFSFVAFSVNRSLHGIRKEHILRLIEYSVQKRIFGPKREDIVREFCKFNSNVLHNLHSLPNIYQIKEFVIGGAKLAEEI
jgi:hypothetical protein